MEGHLCAKDCTSKSLTHTHTHAHAHIHMCTHGLMCIQTSTVHKHLKRTHHCPHHILFLSLCGFYLSFLHLSESFSKKSLYFSSPSLPLFLFPTVFPIALYFSCSLPPLPLFAHVISPFNFTYLELAADSLKYPAVHLR